MLFLSKVIGKFECLRFNVGLLNNRLKIQTTDVFSFLKIILLLEPLASLKKRNLTGTIRLTRNSKIFKTILEAIQEKKGENIVSIDLRKISEAVSDFFIICEASNQPQIRTIAENVEDKVRALIGEKPYHTEGYKNLQWVLIDYVNIVVHVMYPESRRFYKLEEMWSDASIVNHKS